MLRNLRILAASTLRHWPSRVGEAFQNYYDALRCRDPIQIRNTVVVLGGLALVLLYSLWDTWHEKEAGSIFVHGPQVYTRERLVNDRYQEDSWLNAMLEKSPNEVFGYSSTHSLDAIYRRGLDLKLGNVDGTTSGGTPRATLPNDAMPEISAQPTFKLQAVRAYREQIRTMLIENQLDDRHDLHGNTLYRLRFDASILPPEGSRSAARIEITIHPPPNSDVSVADIEQGNVAPDKFDQWLDSWRDLYGRWRTSLELRLEEEASARIRGYDNGRFGPDDYELLFSTLREGIFELEDQIKRKLEPAPQKATTGADCKRVHEHAQDVLSQLHQAKQGFPKDDIPEENLTSQSYKSFREYFVRGQPGDSESESIEPIEWHKAHDKLRARIDQLLLIRQTLVNLVEDLECKPPPVNSALSQAPGAGSLGATIPDNPRPGATSPGRVPPGSVTTGQGEWDQAPKELPAGIAPMAQVPGVGTAGPVSFIGSPVGPPTLDSPRAPPIAQLRRRLLDNVFWPRLYKAVTGVDEKRSDIEGLIPYPLPEPLLVPVESVRRFANIYWDPARIRRTFQVSEWTRTITVSTNPNCFSGLVIMPVIVNDRTKNESKPITLYIAQDAYAPIHERAPKLKINLMLASAVNKLNQKRMESQLKREAQNKVASAGNEQIVADVACRDDEFVGEEVPVTLFNFALKLSKAKEVYTYSISPTEPDELVANRIRQEWADDLSLQAKVGNLLKSGATAGGQVRSEDDSRKNLRFDTPQRSVFGYGERVTTASGPRAKIGWEVLPRDHVASGGSSDRAQLAPKQIPMTALVSLPAWWEKITLEVRKQWVDREGYAVDARQDPRQLPKYEIELPTNFETLDASLFDNADSGPVIIDWQIPRQAVHPCEPFAITLLGRRLWRSTVVTLGGERANRVIVTPSMNGIIAMFDGMPRKGSARAYAPLTVWTSQGNALLPRLVAIDGSLEKGTCPSKSTKQQ